MKFNQYGGCFVAETLIEPLRELERVYQETVQDSEFRKNYQQILKEFVGRPTSLTYASRLSKKLGGARIYLKREDLAHTGAHKINNAVGQALLAKKMGKKRIVAETGAGQHGVATAAAAALLGIECTVYMGAKDIQRQAPNVQRMKLLGASVVSVQQGSETLKDAINEAMRDWITQVHSTYYLLGSALGPHPYPTMVRNFQKVIGIEARSQILSQEGRLPQELVACVGGGSNAIGLFHPFLEDSQCKMIGVEAGGLGIETGKHAARFASGKIGVFHGTKTYLLQNSEGQSLPTHSISAGLDYQAVGPEHAALHDLGRVQYTSATDQEALEAFRTLAREEGIIPALESSHALAYVIKRAPQMSSNEVILVNLSGRGDKDLETVLQRMGADL